MKHVRALVAEPPLLARYRSTYPGEERRPVDEATATWEGFKTDVAAYKQVLEELAQAQQGLCIYCEQRLVDASGALVSNDYQVEHVLAKSGAVGRVLDWTNLALACTGGTYPHHPDASRFTSGPNRSCGQTKDSAELPPRCDPRGHPLVGPLVEVGIDWKITANADNCAAAGVSVPDVEAAVALLHLNCERLRKARQDRHDNINEWFVPLLTELLGATHLSAAQQQQMLDLWIAGRLQPDGVGYLRAFWSTERGALGPGGETWIANNQGLFL
jgi:uncharacterized protein (TIGR02646 family)